MRDRIPEDRFKETQDLMTGAARDFYRINPQSLLWREG